MRPHLLLTLIAIALLAGGYLHGQWTGRWQATERFERLQARLEHVPLVCGPWIGREIEVNSDTFPVNETGPHIMRHYENRLNGQVVAVYLACGRPGPMVIKHLPTECYTCVGYQMSKGPQRYVTPKLSNGDVAEFWHALFTKNLAGVPEYLRVYWSWSSDGEWKTPDRPRLVWPVGKVPTLYKLYVIRKLESEKEAFEGSPAHDFIEAFVPELKRSHFSQP